MDLAAAEELREDLDAFCAGVLASVPRKDSRVWGNCYLRGLMLEGRRKSIQPMAQRLPDGNMQDVQQFVGQSPVGAHPRPTPPGDQGQPDHQPKGVGHR